MIKCDFTCTLRLINDNGSLRNATSVRFSVITLVNCLLGCSPCSLVNMCCYFITSCRLPHQGYWQSGPCRCKGRVQQDGVLTDAGPRMSSKSPAKEMTAARTTSYSVVTGKSSLLLRRPRRAPDHPFPSHAATRSKVMYFDHPSVLW